MTSTPWEKALDKLVAVHRDWCNYCQGDAVRCSDAPVGGCSLRDYLIALDAVPSETSLIDIDYYRQLADGLDLLPTKNTESAALVNCAARLIRSLIARNAAPQESVGPARAVQAADDQAGTSESNSPAAAAPHFQQFDKREKCCGEWDSLAGRCTDCPHDKQWKSPMIYRDILSIALGAQSQATPIVDALLASEGDHNQEWIRTHQIRHIEIAFHEVERRLAEALSATLPSPAVHLALKVLLNHIELGWENCRTVVQHWLDEAQSQYVERKSSETK